MKKYLMMGAAALTMGFAFVSCSSDDDIYNSKAKSEQLAKNYAEAFVQQFGQPAANQTWGFGETTRATRAITRGSVSKPNGDGSWPGRDQSFKDIIPAPISEGEAAFVTEWFENNPGFTTETEIHWKNFFVQNVSGKEYENSIWYHNNGTTEYFTEGDNNRKFKLDELKVGYKNGELTHISDFNSTTVGTADNLRYIEGSMTDDFEYNVSFYNYKSHNFKMAKLTYNGKTAYYVGFTAWCEKPDNGTIEFGAQRKTYCDDWIIKLVPGVGESINEDEVIEQGRIFCEDLGTIGDFDFNDVVFDAYLYESGKIEIDVLAAGGTLPIAVAGVDIKIGKMSNTGVNNGRDTQHISISAEDAAKNEWNSLISIPIVVTRDITDAVDGSYELNAEEGKAPQKICVPLTTDWVDEYENINKAYPDFAKWVKNQVTREDCFANKVDKYVDLKLPNND